MADLTLRLEKGSELTFREIDDNFLNLDSDIQSIADGQDSLFAEINSRLDSEHAWNVSDHSQLQANIDSVNARVTARDSAVVNTIILDLVDSDYVTSRVGIDSDYVTSRVDFEGNIDSDYVRERVKTDQELLTSSDVEFQHIEMTHASGALSFLAKNETGSQITKGSAVYINGVSGSTPTIALAANTSASTMPSFGLVWENIPDGSTGYVITQGTGPQMNTSSFTAGETLYVGAVPGTLTNTKPSGTALIQNIGKAQTIGASGLVKVGGSGRTNDTPNLMSGQVFYGDVSNYATPTALTSIVDSAYLSNFITNGYLNDIGVGVTLASTDDLAEGSSNLYYTEARVNSVFGKRTTDSLSEGSSNLYFTDARVDTRVSALNTDNLSEGSTNLYYTDTRARGAVSAGSGISYVAGTGVFSVAGNTNLTQDADGLSLSTSPTGLTNVGTSKVTLGSWTIELSGNDLVFKFGGASKLKLSSTGQLTALSDITAFGTP